MKKGAERPLSLCVDFAGLKYIIFWYVKLGSFEDARRFVIDVNERRRHSTPSQRGMAAAKLAKIEYGSNRHTLQKLDGPQGPSKISNEQAAKMLKIGTGSVKRAKAVLSKGGQEHRGNLRMGEGGVREGARAPLFLLARHLAKQCEPLCLGGPCLGSKERC